MEWVTKPVELFLGNPGAMILDGDAPTSGSFFQRYVSTAAVTNGIVQEVVDGTSEHDGIATSDQAIWESSLDVATVLPCRIHRLLDELPNIDTLSGWRRSLGTCEIEDLRNHGVHSANVDGHSISDAWGR
ncbi:MAG: hypothetical protein O9303_13700 [Silanimonas sp.]|jgi:hypothetical protein|nr:hypothetical protein [Silanimonas sp.]